MAEQKEDKKNCREKEFYIYKRKKTKVFRSIREEKEIERKKSVIIAK